MGLDNSTLNDVAMQHHLTLKYFGDRNVVLCTICYTHLKKYIKQQQQRFYNKAFPDVM